MSVTTIDPMLSVNETIRRYPAALDLLARQGIDTCCGGALSLAAASADAGVDLSRLLHDLADATAKAREGGR